MRGETQDGGAPWGGAPPLRWWTEDRMALVVVSVLLLYLGTAALYRASTQPFWYDEICTDAVLRQATPAGMWHALRDAADTQPPGFYLVESVSARLIANKHIGYRVPSILGAMCVSLALFYFVSRRAGNVAGLIAAIAPVPGPLWDTFALEGRPYAMLAACGAVSICLWRKSGRWGAAAALALVLAAASSLHYFGVLLAVPVGLAEAVRWGRSREFRLSAWLATCCGALPLLAWRPLLASLKTAYGGSFWAQPKLEGIAASYGHLLGVEVVWGAGLAAAVAAGVVAMLARAWQGRSTEEGATPAEEYAMLLGLLALPAMGFVAARVTHGGLSPRYVIATAVGLWAGLVLLAPRSGEKAARWLLLFMAAVLFCEEGLAWMNRREAPGQTDELKWTAALLRGRGDLRELPLVLADGKMYLPWAYYRGQRHEAGGIALVDGERAVRFTGTDSVDKGLAILAKYRTWTCASSRRSRRGIRGFWFTRGVRTAVSGCRGACWRKGTGWRCWASARATPCTWRRGMRSPR